MIVDLVNNSQIVGEFKILKTHLALIKVVTKLSRLKYAKELSSPVN